MKIEIEIPDDEISGEIARKARSEFRNQISSYKTDEKIRGLVREMLAPTIETIVKETASSHDALREKVAKEFERQLRAKIAAAIKAAGK
jgi:hypothetical protein